MEDVCKSVMTLYDGIWERRKNVQKQDREDFAEIFELLEPFLKDIETIILRHYPKGICNKYIEDWDSYDQAVVFEMDKDDINPSDINRQLKRYEAAWKEIREKYPVEIYRFIRLG